MRANVSHVDATIATECPPRSDPASADAETFARLRNAMIRMFKGAPGNYEPFCEALEVLDVIQQAFEQAGQRNQPEPAAGITMAATSSRRRAAAQKYEVRETADGAFLEERRPGESSQPFRCPRATYDAAARVPAG